MLILLLVPLAFLGYFLSTRFLFRKWRYRWAVWLWALTYWVQLPFFFGGDAWVYAIDPVSGWADAWRKSPGMALWLLLIPSVPAYLAYWVQHRRLTRPPAPPGPPRPCGGTHPAGGLPRVSASVGVVVSQWVSTAPRTCLLVYLRTL